MVDMSLPANATFVQAFLRILFARRIQALIPPIQTHILLLLYPKPRHGYPPRIDKGSLYWGFTYNHHLQYVTVHMPVDVNSCYSFYIPISEHRAVCPGCSRCWNILRLVLLCAHKTQTDSVSARILPL